MNQLVGDDPADVGRLLLPEVGGEPDRCLVEVLAYLDVCPRILRWILLRELNLPMTKAKDLGAAVHIVLDRCCHWTPSETL